MKTRKKTIVAIVVYFLLCLFFVVFLIYPELNKIKAISEKISSTKSNLNLIEAKRKNIENFAKILPKIKDNLKELENSMVSKDFPVDFVGFLEDVAKEKNLAFEFLSSHQLEDSIVFGAKILGNFVDVLRFLEKVENCQYLVEFEKVSISKPSEKENLLGPNLLVNFSIRVQAK